MFDPKYSIDNDLINDLVRIAELKAIIDHSKIIPKQEIILKKRAAIRMAASSTAIEGNLLNEMEVKKVFENKEIYAPMKDEVEVKNYKKGIEFINKIFQDKIKINHNLITHLHKILMADLLPEEKLGKYRKGPVYVVNQSIKDPKDRLLYEAPHAKEVTELIENLLEWTEKSTKKNLNPLIIAALFHYEFVTIHPFTDGNGRITRLLTTYLLYLHGFELNKIFALDSYYNNDRMSYYKNLDVGKTYQERKIKDLTAWVKYFVNGVCWELTRIIDQITMIKVQTKDDDETHIYLDQDEIRIIDFLATMGTITSQDVADILKLSKRSAQLKLKRLSELSLIDTKGKGPSSYYVLRDKD